MGHKIYTKQCEKYGGARVARVDITFEDLLKAVMASLLVEQKETIKNIVLLVKNALKIFYCCKPRTSKLHETFQCKQLFRQK